MWRQVSQLADAASAEHVGKLAPPSGPSAFIGRSATMWRQVSQLADAASAEHVGKLAPTSGPSAFIGRWRLPAPGIHPLGGADSGRGYHATGLAGRRGRRIM